MQEAERQQGAGGVDEGVEERWCSEEQTPQKHHTLATEHIRERTGWQLDNDPCDGRGGHDQAEHLGRGSQVLGEARQYRAPGHLIAKASQEAGQYQGDERCHVRPHCLHRACPWERRVTLFQRLCCRACRTEPCTMPTPALSP